MSDFLDLETNIPQTVALAYDDGKIVETRFGDKLFFTLVDGRTLSLKPEAAAPIHELGIRRRQPFCICKRETKGANGKKFNVIDIWLPGAGESLPPAVSPQSQLEADLARSIEHVQAKQAGASVPAPAPVAAAQAPAAQPAVTHNGNGSSSGNGKAYAAAGIPAPPNKIPYDVAFRELLKIVVDSLKEAGEQWSDAAKQDALSTLLIQASRDGFLSCWQRSTK